MYFISLSLTLTCLTAFSTFSHLVHSLPQENSCQVQCKGGLGRDGSLSVEDAAAMRPDY